MSALRDHLLRVAHGQIDGMLEGLWRDSEEYARDEDGALIADDCAAICAKLLAARAVVEARMGRGPVRNAAHGNVGVRENGPHSFEDATGDVSSSFHVHRDLGDETEAA